MQNEPTRKEIPRESAGGELRAILPWFIIPVVIILVLVGMILFLPRDQAEAGQTIGHNVATAMLERISI